MTEENMNNEKTVALLSSKEKSIYILDTDILLHQPLFIPIYQSKIPRPHLASNLINVTVKKIRESNQEFIFGEVA